jgi:hypothetical protein
MKMNKKLSLILVIILSVFVVSSFAGVSQKLPRRSSGWADLSAGKTLTETNHGALSLNYQHTNKHYALQILFYQFCSTSAVGCVEGPHHTFNFLYGRARYINPYVKVYAQTGIAALGAEADCKLSDPANPTSINECNKTTDFGIPIRVGVSGGHFVGLSLEFTGLLSANHQIVGLQFGLPMGVF